MSNNNRLYYGSTNSNVYMGFTDEKRILFAVRIIRLQHMEAIKSVDLYKLSRMKIYEI